MNLATWAGIKVAVEESVRVKITVVVRCAMCVYLSSLPLF